jgi:ribosome-binding protein aMBF1 (putative translation factor)
MPRTYRDVVANRRARLTAEAREQQRVLERAYDIAVQVMELREKHGLTQAQLAERCGIAQADISRIERGATSPTARTLQRLAEALHADHRLGERASSRCVARPCPGEPDAVIPAVFSAAVGRFRCRVSAAERT